MLSIVVPTFNEEAFLPFLLQSIGSQSFRDYEIIVADNGSTDGTVRIAEEGGARVVPGGLPSRGRNRGAAVARGDTILFLDSDVVLPGPDFLEMTVNEFRERKLAAATCRVRPMSNRAIDRVLHAVFNLYMLITQRGAPHAPGFCIFVRKDIHDRIGGFDEGIKLAEDHDYVSRAAKYGRFGVLKTQKIPVSVRRLDRDGRMNIARKYLKAELYIRTRGNIRTDAFNYTWGYGRGAKPGTDGPKRP
ncbi:glycosyltransferase [Candidatus Uhrbacteria bacterium]|nr:glycosyltransferase [Candidatus Uhrbacteria bacterium]